MVVRPGMPKSARVWTKPGQNVRAPGGAVRDAERGLREVVRSDPDRADQYCWPYRYAARIC